MKMFSKSKSEVGFKKNVDSATIPTKDDKDAGFDLYVNEIFCVEQHNQRHRKCSTNSEGRWEIHPGTVFIAKTGISCEFPDGHFGLIKPRSGVSLKYGVNVLAGVVDESYNGEICVIFTTTYHFDIGRGERIAQMVVSPYFNGGTSEVTSLSDTNRGKNGFGSSGK